MKTEIITQQSLAYDYAETSQRVHEALTQAFPKALFALSEGWQGRVHVKFVSPELNGKTEHEKQQIVWDGLSHHLGEEAAVVSLITAYSLDEI